jgi:hypothetical protein
MATASRPFGTGRYAAAGNPNCLQLQATVAGRFRQENIASTIKGDRLSGGNGSTAGQRALMPEKLCVFAFPSDGAAAFFGRRAAAGFPFGYL